MDWLFICWIALLLGTVSTQSDGCVKSFQPRDTLPDGELMKALYHADPNPAIGKLSISWKRNTVTAQLIRSTLDFTTWLAQPHDAVKGMANLWSFFTRIIVSELEEGLTHFKISSEQGTNKPDGIVDIRKLQTHFIRQACVNFNSKKNSWPYRCLDKEFFCDMDTALTALSGVLHDGNELKTIWNLHGMSELGVDSIARRNALQAFFTKNILEFIRPRVQENVFYHSRLPWECIKRLVSTNSFTSWLTKKHFNAVKNTVTSQCNQHSNEPIGKMYYCKAKHYIEKFVSCNNQADKKPCLLDAMFQETFNKGWIVPYMAVKSITLAGLGLHEAMEEFMPEVLEQDRNGLLRLYNKYNPHITVKDSMCSTDWPKVYQCRFEECMQDWVYRPDCIMKFLLKAVKRLTDASASRNWADSAVKKAKSDLIIWMSYFPLSFQLDVSFESSVIDPIVAEVQRKIKIYVEQFNIRSLKTYVATLPPIHFVPKNMVEYTCSSPIYPRYHAFCILEPLLTSVSLFINAYHDSVNPKVKVLNPTVDYKTVLKQIQLDVASKAIQSQNEAFFNRLTGQLQRNFGSLSNYFTSLADYDKDKAEADIAYIDGRLTHYKTKIHNVSGIVSGLFQNIFIAAFQNNVLELAVRVIRLSVAIIQLANPMGIFTGDLDLMDMMDALDELAQAGVTTAILVQLQRDAIPDLVKDATKLGEAFYSNENQLRDAKKLIDELKFGIDATTTASTFLGKYNAYDPKVVMADISSYGTKLETIIEQMCEAAFAGGTAVAAVGEIMFANKGECVKVHGPVAELIALFEEAYEYQFDLMDALSDTSRAYLAQQKAKDLKLVYSHTDRVDQNFLQKFAVNSYIVSTLNLWELITEYCDVLTYTRGGHVPGRCTSALRNPSHAAIAQVIGYTPSPLCHVNNEITHYVSIPVTPSGPNDKAYLDLNELYHRKTVSFKIPNFQWLVDHRWVERHDKEKALYIARFEIYLPPMTSHHMNTIEVNVEPSMENFLKYNETKYLIPVTGYSARYTENAFNCYTTKRDHPYQICNQPNKRLIKICLTSEGYVDRLVQPSIYNEWKVTVKTIPSDFTVPDPKTDFRLQAGLTTCMIDLYTSRRKRDSDISQAPDIAISRTKRDEQHCNCASNQYWSRQHWACRRCPAGTSVKDKGYYCE